MVKKTRLKKITFEIPPLFIIEKKPEKIIKQIRRNVNTKDGSTLTSYRLKTIKSRKKKK